MPKTTHFKTRIQQRGILQSTIDAAQKYGFPKGDKVIFGKKQIDLALINGPAPRMAFQGQCMAFHVACGEGGMATNLDQFGPALKLPWTRLEAPELDKALREKMVDGCNKMAEGKDFKQMALQRDKAIVSILKALKGLK